MHIKVAAIQMVSTTNLEQNMATAERLLGQAANQGAQWALLPEYWPIMGRKDTDKLALAEPFGQGVFQGRGDLQLQPAARVGARTAGVHQPAAVLRRRLSGRTHRAAAAGNATLAEQGGRRRAARRPRAGDDRDTRGQLPARSRLAGRL